MKGGNLRANISSKVKIAQVQVASIERKAMRIPITIRINGQTTLISALIDSGAEGNFIQQELVDTLKIHQYPLKHPIQAQNVDGTPVKGSNIHQYAILPIKEGTYFHPTKLQNTGIEKEQIILGHP